MRRRLMILGALLVPVAAVAVFVRRKDMAKSPVEKVKPVKPEPLDDSGGTRPPTPPSPEFPRP